MSVILKILLIYSISESMLKMPKQTNFEYHFRGDTTHRENQVAVTQNHILLYPTFPYLITEEKLDCIFMRRTMYKKS
jgi:hypothetical protein